MGGVAELKTYLSRMCYHVKFGCSAAKGVRINRKEPQIWGALGPRPLGVGLGCLKTSPQYVLSREIWYFCVEG